MPTARELKILAADWKRGHNNLYTVVNRDQIVVAICSSEEIAKNILDLHNHAIQIMETVEHIPIADGELNRFKEILFSKNQNTDVKFLCSMLTRFIEIVDEEDES